jgi:hypothetical protein
MTNSTYAATLSGTGWAIGNGSITCRYFQLGKLVFVHYRLVWGTTSTFGPVGPILTLPVTADTTLQSTDSTYRGLLGLLGSATVSGNGSASEAVGASLHTGGTAFEAIFWDVASANGQSAPATNSNVFASAASTGWLQMSGWYIAA